MDGEEVGKRRRKELKLLLDIQTTYIMCGRDSSRTDMEQYIVLMFEYNVGNHISRMPQPGLENSIYNKSQYQIWLRSYDLQ